MPQGKPHPSLDQLLNELVHLASVADEACSNHEKGAHAALCAYGQKHREIIKLYDRKPVSEAILNAGP